MLVETVHNADVITNEEFAIFQNAGYMGLYGGLMLMIYTNEKNWKPDRKFWITWEAQN